MHIQLWGLIKKTDFLHSPSWLWSWITWQIQTYILKGLREWIGGPGGFVWLKKTGITILFYPVLSRRNWKRLFWERWTFVMIKVHVHILVCTCYTIRIFPKIKEKDNNLGDIDYPYSVFVPYCPIWPYYTVLYVNTVCMYVRYMLYHKKKNVKKAKVTEYLGSGNVTYPTFRKLKNPMRPFSEFIWELQSMHGKLQTINHTCLEHASILPMLNIIK